MAYANDLVNAMRLVGYSRADMLPAYPGKTEAYLDHLWRDTGNASNRFVMPYGLLGTKACNSRYFNVHPGGFRSNGRQQPWPPDDTRVNIFFFGGSHTIAYGLEDEQTIPAQLQCNLESSGVQCEVYNFGGGSYGSRHTALLFLDLVDRGITPDHAVFLDGHIDSVYGLGQLSLVDLLDTLFQNERRRHRLSWLKGVVDFAVNSHRERRRPSTLDEPVVRREEDSEVDTYLSDDGITRALEMSTKQIPADEISAAGVRLAKRVWKGYLDSVALIRSVASQVDTETAFVWQPVPWFMTAPEQRVMERLFPIYRHTAFCSPVYHWLHTQGFPSMQDDPDFVNLADVGVSLPGKLYVDAIHYSSFF